MNIFCEDAPRYYLRILMYLADRPPVPEDAVDQELLKKLTAHGISRAINVPISSTYSTLNWMEAGQLIAPLDRRVMIMKQKARAYRLTENGRRYAEAVRAFKRSVEAL